MFKRFVFCLTLLITSYSVVLAAVLPLSEAVELAIRNNPEIQSAKNGWEAAKAKVPAAYWLPAPKLGADFERIPAGSSDLRQAEMRFYNFSQMLPWPGLLWSEGQAASARAGMLAGAYQAKEREVIRQVKAAYYSLAKIDQVIKILRENVLLLRQAYKVTQAKYAVGSASQIEALKLQIELNRMENELTNWHEERTIKNLELNLLLNNPSEGKIAVAVLPAETTLRLEYPSLVEAALKNSPRLRLEASSLAEAQAMVGVAYATYFPETMAKLRSQKAGSSVGANDLMLEFSLPLWFLVRENRQLEEAQKKVKAAEASYQAMKNRLRQEVKEHFIMLGIYSRKLKLYEASLLSASSAALKTSLAGYRAGQTEFLDLLDSFRTALDINREYYETLTDYLTTQAKLEEIVGGELK